MPSGMSLPGVFAPSLLSMPTTICPTASSFTGTGGPGNSNATITVFYYCGDRTICIESTKGISNFQFNNAAKVENFGDPTEICLAVPPGATSITIKAGTTVITFNIPADI